MAPLVDGRYELIEVIGSGGMATVWRARDVKLERQVALKRPHPVPSDDPRADRLSREARLAASISHPHLVSVHDAGADGDGLYLVMELVEAPSLAQVGGQLHPDHVLEVGMQVARALAAVHRSGVVHRDVKPGNVLMADGGAKLTDFGIAVSETPMTGDQPTAPGDLLATANYAAPEILVGHPATDRSDIFALGVVIYELLAGQAPFVGVDRTRRPATLPGSVGPVLDRCLSPYPEDRPSASALAAELNGALADLRSVAGVSANGATVGYGVTPPATSAQTTTAMPHVPIVPAAPPGPPTGQPPNPIDSGPGPGGYDPTATQVMGARPPMALGERSDAPGLDPVEPPRRPPNNTWIGPAVFGVIALAAIITVLALLSGALNGSSDDGQQASDTSESQTTITVPTSEAEAEVEEEQGQDTQPEADVVEEFDEVTPDDAAADEVESSDSQTDGGADGSGDGDGDSGFGDGFFDSLRDVEDFVDSVTEKANEIDATAKDVRDVMKKVEEATKLARESKPQDAADKLEEAADKVRDRFDGQSRTRLLNLLDDVADQLDLPELELAERYGESEDGD